MFAETTTQQIDSWDVREAFERARSVVERYEARPYGFRFSTRERGEADLDSKETAESGWYYLLGDAGKIETAEEILARNDPQEGILCSNIRCNGYKRLLTTFTPYRHTHPLEDGDIVLNANGEVIQ